MREIIKKRWNYVFYEQNNNFYISVLCGKVGLYDTIVKLNKEELDLYQLEGEEFIDKFAQMIRDNPTQWKNREK